MKQVLFLFQIIVACLLILAILVQQKGSGLGSTFGGADMSFYRTKRGAEKLLFYATIILVSIFVVLSILGLIIP